MGTYSLQRALFLAFAHFLAFVTGIVALRPESGPINLFLTWLLAFSVVLACIADAHSRGKSILPIVQFLMLATWPIAAPACLFWARGWRAIPWLLLFTFTLSATYIATTLTFYAIATRPSP